MAANWVYIANLRGPTGPVGPSWPLTKCVRLESGVWVWDLAGGTHYVIPEHDGTLAVRATAAPVPTATPALDW